LAAQHDLRRKAHRITELIRRHDAHERLSDEEMNELRIGPTVEEYKPIIDSIRAERRSAAPSKKTRAKNEERTLTLIQSEPLDLTKYGDDDDNE
jgi:hypothetical protein